MEVPCCKINVPATILPLPPPLVPWMREEFVAVSRSCFPAGAHSKSDLLNLPVTVFRV